MTNGNPRCQARTTTEAPKVDRSNHQRAMKVSCASNHHTEEAPLRPTLFFVDTENPCNPRYARIFVLHPEAVHRFTRIMFVTPTGDCSSLQPEIVRHSHRKLVGTSTGDSVSTAINLLCSRLTSNVIL